MTVAHRVVVAMAFLLSLRPAAAREFQVEIIAETVDDLYAYEERGELDESDVETLSGFLSQPLDLNQAASNLLFELPGVTTLVAQSVVRYRSETGGFGQVDELLDVPGFTIAVLAQIRPFVRVRDRRPERAAHKSTGTSGVLRSGLQLRQGFVPPWDTMERQVDDRLEREHGPQGFVQFRSSDRASVQFGGLVTYRRGMSVDWDPTFNGSTGRLVSEGSPNNRVRFDQLYLASAYGGLKVVLGSYSAGFGERLTFNTTERQLPSGWYPNVTITEDNVAGRLRVRDRQFGVALQYERIPLGSAGWLEGSAFASSNTLDLFQRDLAYEGRGNVCDVEGYTCSSEFDGTFPDARTQSEFVVDGRARSFRVSAPDDSTDYDFEQIRRAFRENLVGGNLTLHVDSTFSLGVTSYLGRTEFNLDPGAAANFAYSSGWVRQEHQPYGAVGTHLRWLHSDFDLGVEFAYSFVDGGGIGVLLRANITAIPSVDLTGRVWRYGANFINPKGNGSAGADEVFGERNRNDRGGRIHAVVNAIKSLRLRTTVEYRQNPSQVFLTPAGYETFRRATLLDDLHISQRADCALSSQDELFVNLRYDNRILRRLDLDAETFSGESGVPGGTGDTCYPLSRELTSGENAGLRISDCSTGTRTQVQIGANTRRVPRTRLYVRGDYVRQAGIDSDRDGNWSRGHSFRMLLRARFTPWSAGTLIGHMTLRPERTLGFAETENDGNEVRLRSSEPRRSYSIEYVHRAGDELTLSGRYGFQDYNRSDLTNRFDTGRYSFYNAFRLKAEYRF